MENHQRKLLTVVTEAVLESVISADMTRMGAHGYTVADVRGKGNRGVRPSTWEAVSNIRIEVVCDARTADAIASYLEDHYYTDYAMILFISDVTVLRPDKF